MPIKLAVFDMDGVLTKEKSSWGFVNRRLGIDNSSNLESLRNGKIEYKDLFIKEVKDWLRVDKGFSGDALLRILSEIKLVDNLQRSIREVSEMGISCAIISGGLYPLASRIAGMTGIKIVHANDILLNEQGILTPRGKIMVDPTRKDRVIAEVQKSLEVREDETVSIGDSPEDEKMFIRSGKSIFISHSHENQSKVATLTLEAGDLAPVASKIKEWNYTESRY